MYTVVFLRVYTLFDSKIVLNKTGKLRVKETHVILGEKPPLPRHSRCSIDVDDQTNRPLSISQVARKKNMVGNQSSIRRSLVDATSRLSWRRGGKQEVMSGGAEETLRDERTWSVVAAKSRQSSTIEERLLRSGLASERKRLLLFSNSQLVE